MLNWSFLHPQERDYRCIMNCFSPLSHRSEPGIVPKYYINSPCMFLCITRVLVLWSPGADDDDSTGVEIGANSLN